MIMFIVIGSTPITDVAVLEHIYQLVSNTAMALRGEAIDTSYAVILLLAGSALFVFTLLVNAVAEVIRYRLRKYYRTL